LADNVADDGRGCAKLAVAEQVDHIVQIARARSLTQRADFFAEDFLEGIASSAVRSSLMRGRSPPRGAIGPR
jgi:hypothetical protein